MQHPVVILFTRHTIVLEGAFEGIWLHWTIVSVMVPSETSETQLLINHKVYPVLHGQLSKLIAVRESPGCSWTPMGLPDVVSSTFRTFLEL